MSGDKKQRADPDIDALLALLEQPDLSLYQAEQMLTHLQPGLALSREQIVDRLLAILETFGSPNAPPALAPALTPDLGPRIASQETALILLSFLGDKAVVPRLLALIEKGTLSDEFKLKLISVIHEFDPERDPDDLLSQLRNPYKAMQQSHREHLQRMHSPLELGYWLDVMAQEMPPEARASFVRASAEINEPLAIPLLICLCYDEDPGVALAAIDAVERYKDARALPALEELAKRYPADAVLREAGKAADRLRIRASLAPQVDPEPPPPLYLCYLTTIDGRGGQVALLVRETLPGMLRIAQVVFADEMGIEDCFGMDIAACDLDDLLNELVERGMSPVDVPYAQFIETLEFASETTWRDTWLLPTSFVAWREWLTWECTHSECTHSECTHSECTHGEQVEQGTRARTEPPYEQLFVSALPAKKRTRLLHNCPELLFQDEFTHWVFDEEDMDELEDAYWGLVEQGQGQPPASPAIRALLREFVDRIVTDDMRDLIRERLRRVAPLLRDLYVEDEVWQWAVVAADAMVDGSALPLREHPLLLAMAAQSLENVIGAEVKWRS